MTLPNNNPHPPFLPNLERVIGDAGPANTRQYGLTLIELMIAMLLGLFIIGGITKIFISSKQTYKLQEALSRLQENGRFAMDFIGRDIRMAGYDACPSNPPITTAVGGANGNQAPTPDAPDTLTLNWNTAPCGAPTAVVNANYSIDNVKHTLLKNGEALFEDVENMQVEYGVDTDGDNTPNYYVPADSPGLVMANVTSLRLSLLLSTTDPNLASQPLTYSYNGEIVIPPNTDRKIRRVFTSTFALRNRLP